MYVNFLLAALLAATGIAGAVDRLPESAATASAPHSVAVPKDDAISVEQHDLLVPPVDPAGDLDPEGARPEVTDDSAQVVADQLVTPARVQSAVIESDGFQTLGVTWPEGADVNGLDGQVRTRTNGAWSSWIDLRAGDDEPDAGSPDALHAVRGGTEPLSIGDADAVQLNFAADADGGPDGMKLALVGSDTRTAPVTAVAPAATTTSGVATSGVATVRAAAFAPVSTRVTAAATVPRVISRTEWGAPAQACTPDVASELVGAVVHHTADSNNYSSVAEAMRQIRNDAAYHISGRGWCDIGYNFVVDKWGNIYEGRAGSMDKPVVGAHTGGFNTRTVGVAMLGTFDGAPSAATQQAVGEIIGWRLGNYGVDPQSSMTYYTGNGENSRFRNQNVGLPRIFGHRDTAFTACPGNGGEAALTNIRSVAAVVARTAPRINSVPFGSLDALSTTSSTITIGGWALDPDTSGSVAVHAYLDGAFLTAVTASASRPDVGAMFGDGDLHGFNATVPAPQGPHTLCLYLINLPLGSNPVLTCRAVAVGNIPTGSLDTVEVTPTSIGVHGWAMDADTKAPIPVHAYLDGAFLAAFTANDPRTDVGRVFGNGANHGFNETMTVEQGTHTLCLYLINNPVGSNPILACRVVTVGHAPTGSLDVVRTSATSLSVEGWALDLDTTAPIAMHAYLDGRFAAATVANTRRVDVGRAFGNGDDHGFALTMSASSGAHSVCLYLINVPAGPNSVLACRVVTVG